MNIFIPRANNPNYLFLWIHHFYEINFRHYAWLNLIFSDCPQLNVSSQTQVTYTEERVFGSITTLTCDNGYSFVQEEFHQQSSVSMECQYGGDWDKSRVPNCMSKIFVQISIYCDLCFIRAKYLYMYRRCIMHIPSWPWKSAEKCDFPVLKKEWNILFLFIMRIPPANKESCLYIYQVIYASRPLVLMRIKW